MSRVRKGLAVSLVAVFTVILIFAYVLRFQAVNRQMKSAPVQEYRMGEEVQMEQDILINYTMEGYSIRVDDAEVLTYREFLDKYHAEDEYSYVPEKVYDIEVTLRNIDADEGTGINLIEFYIQGTAVCAGIDANLCSVANPELKGAYAIALRENSGMVLHLPFALYEENFREDTWKNLRDFEMNFVAALYPAKKVIKL